MNTKAETGWWVPVAPGLSMPDTVTVKVEDWTGFDIELTVVPGEGRLVAKAVSVSQRDGGPPVTGEVLRSIPVARLTKEAAVHVVALGEDEFGTSTLTPWVFTPEVVKGLRDAGPAPSTLEAVAHLYRLALLKGEPPTKAVEETLGLPRSTAGRWVGLARQEGHLGAAEGPGKAGG